MRTEPTVESVKRIPLLIDTDIGDDADDALALVFACRSPELNLLGVSTVSGDTVARAREAGRLLGLLGRGRVPVESGPEGLASLAEKAAGASSGGLTLVCIGPLTNVAELIRRNPAITARLREIVFMGGCYYEKKIEWNVKQDPESAAFVFRSGVPIRAVGLDVTLKCPLPDAFMKSLFFGTDPVLAYLAEVVKSSLRFRGHSPYLHDPLAVFAVFASEKFLKFEEAEVRIELGGGALRGITTLHGIRAAGIEDGSGQAEASPAGRARIAVSVDAAGFTKLFSERTAPGARP